MVSVALLPAIATLAFRVQAVGVPDGLRAGSVTV